MQTENSVLIGRFRGKSGDTLAAYCFKGYPYVFQKFSELVRPNS